MDARSFRRPSLSSPPRASGRGDGWGWPSPGSEHCQLALERCPLCASWGGRGGTARVLPFPLDPHQDEKPRGGWTTVPDRWGDRGQELEWLGLLLWTRSAVLHVVPETRWDRPRHRPHQVSCPRGMRFKKLTTWCALDLIQDKERWWDVLGIGHEHVGRFFCMENVHLGIIRGHVNWSRVRTLYLRAYSVPWRPRKGTGFRNRRRACGHLLSSLLLTPQPRHTGFSGPRARNYDELVETFLDFWRYLLGKSCSHSSPPMPSPSFETDTWLFKVKYYINTALGQLKHYYLETLSNLSVTEPLVHIRKWFTVLPQHGFPEQPQNGLEAESEGVSVQLSTALSFRKTPCLVSRPSDF